MIQPIQLAELFLDGNDAEALVQVRRFLEEYTQHELFARLLTPAMYHIGELWENNEIGVADEHLATAVCDFVVSAVENRKQQGDGTERKVMVLGPEGEDHYIGLKMVSSRFRENGWSVKYLGPNLPLDHALDAAKRWEPDAIALSAALVYRLPLIKTYIKEFLELDPKPIVFLGGRAVSKANPEALRNEGAIVLEDLEQLERWLTMGEELQDGYGISV
ncbi:cobalamin B12-binding domain-containing protein [Planococcus sp. FY231025]|uniref:cobalamin B12-binding domain-containing protein n=1 Tax=Planococcus sp. FY231025 TaxID=3455699 RepID=UPI003F92EFFC